MRETETRSFHRMKRFVEIQEALIGLRAEFGFHRLDQIRPDPVGAKHRAFEAKLRQLAIRVTKPQVAVEFEAIVHNRRLGEADVLRPQVTVPLDDSADLDALF